MGIADAKATYIVEYPQAVKFCETQLGIFWLPDEIKVEKDIQDIRTNMTEAERHGVITTLKLFTMYELIVGGEYWQDMVFEAFQRPADVQRMAKTFSFMELCVHAPFYAKINELLGLATDDFYTEYLDDDVLVDRISYLHNGADAVRSGYAMSLACLALVEGVVLYSNFAFLKHFQSKGKNKLLNIVRGINFSVRDESLHSDASTWIFRTMVDEGYFSLEDHKESIMAACKVAYEHECKIIEKIFEKGTIDGITDLQMKRFVESRINKVLENLGYEKMFEVSYNPIASWFYDGINKYIANDFFTGQGREYVRNWEESGFEW